MLCVCWTRRWGVGKGCVHSGAAGLPAGLQHTQGSPTGVDGASAPTGAGTTPTGVPGSPTGASTDDLPTGTEAMAPVGPRTRGQQAVEGGDCLAASGGEKDQKQAKATTAANRLRDDAQSFLRERKSATLKRPAAALKDKKTEPAKDHGPKKPKGPGGLKKRPAASSAVTAQGQGTKNFAFKAKFWGECKAEFYSQKSYLRRYDDASGKYVMIIGSTAPQHKKICYQLVKHVKAGLSQEALLRAREHIVSALQG